MKTQRSSNALMKCYNHQSLRPRERYIWWTYLTAVLTVAWNQADRDNNLNTMKGVGYLWDEARAAKPSRHREELDRGPMVRSEGMRTTTEIATSPGPILTLVRDGPLRSKARLRRSCGISCHSMCYCYGDIEELDAY